VHRRKAACAAVGGGGSVVPVVPVYNTSGEQVGEMALADSVFGVDVNRAVLHQVVVGYLANRRQGTVATKTRGRVRGGGRKQWRQKGTGHARQGSRRAPHWKGGGTVFGPQPREYRHALPRAMRHLALRSALSARVAEGRLRVLDSLELERPRTRELLGILGRLSLGDTRTLVVTAQSDANVYLSGRNAPDVETTAAMDLNALLVLRARSVVLTRDAVSRLEGVLASDRARGDRATAGD
jgi:large subunit ribosomal protein L4